MSNITFIAGIPGAGKTALLLDLLLREVIPQNRPIFIDQRLNPITHQVGPSIPDLNIPHQLIADARTWHEDGVLPDGACLVLDEAQDIWPVTPSGQKPSADLLALNRLRHRGITMYLASQRPAMINAHVRGLVGRYILLRNLGVLGRRWYEWPEFPEHPLAFRSAPQQKRYTLPKRVFELYKSSSMHVKHKTTVPRALILAGLALVALLVMAVYAYRSVSSKVEGAKPKPPATAPAGAPGAAAPAGRALPPPGQPGPRLQVSLPVPDREPYAGMGVHLAGSYSDGRKTFAWFALSVGGRVVQVISQADLLRPGYAFRSYGPCSGVLIWGEGERVVWCDAPSAAPMQARPGQPAASAPGA